MVSLPGGLEAFGVFVAMVILGRERLQQGKAKRLFEKPNLVFSESLDHIAALSHLTISNIRNSLYIMKTVAKKNGSEPWMSLDETSHLVIRSFFKFNTREDWGGRREGAGRKSRQNQDDSKNNHLENSRFPSSSSSSSLNTTPPTPSSGGGVCVLPLSDDEEPFAEPGTPLPVPTPSPVANDPAEVEQVAAKAERLFPQMDFGIKVKQLAGDVPMAHMDYALEQARAADCPQWKYIYAILKRVEKEGLPKRPPVRAAPASNVLTATDPNFSKRLKPPGRKDNPK